MNKNKIFKKFKNIYTNEIRTQNYTKWFNI